MFLPYATVTVVIPCYNAEPYLEAAVASVQSQSYQDYHIVLVDDASPDRTRALAHRLAETSRKITVVELPENRGRCYARNRGTEMTRGPYVTFLDQDDSYHPEFLRITTALLSKAPRLDAVKVLPNIRVAIDPVRFESVANSLATTMLLSRRAFEFCGGWPETQLFRDHPGGCEDIAFQKFFSFCFNTGILREKLYNYSHRPGNALDRFLKRTVVVDGRVVFQGPGDADDQKLAVENERLLGLLRLRVRRAWLEAPTSAFVRLGEEA
jgi:glycosyltransferase involved in cell wall biosynthesis